MISIEGFTHLGLSTRDSRVYIALLREGESSVRRIAEVTRLNRGSVYESIKALQDAGLVQYRQANVNKKYFAEEPQKILELIDYKRQELDAVQQHTEARLIPELMKSAAYLPYSNIKFYEDDAGIASILKDVLATCEKLDEKKYRVISSKPLRKYIFERFPDIAPKRIKKGIHVQVLAVGSGGSVDALSERKWLSETGRQPASYNFIYGDKFAMIALNNGVNPFGVVVENKGVAEMQKLLFDNLWSTTR